MNPIHGYWLIVINWTFVLGSRILLIITQGRAAWLNAFAYLSPVLNLALGLVALFVAKSGQILIKHRIVLMLTGSAMLAAGALGLTSLVPYWWVQWPGLEKTFPALGMLLETVWIFGAVVLGLAGTTDLVKRLFVLGIPVLRVVLILLDLQAALNVGLLVMFVVMLFVLLGSYSFLTRDGTTAWQLGP